MKIKILSFAIFFVFLSSCLSHKPSKNPGQSVEFKLGKSESIYLKNSLSIPKQGGHIQGIQFYQKGDQAYYFFTGSSAHQSYLAIADAKKREIISWQKLLDEPYRHAGGFQILNDLLTVGIEDNKAKDKSLIHLYRILEPQKGELRLLKTLKRKGAYKKMTAGSVALTTYEGYLWICVGNWDNQDLDVYRLEQSQLENPSVDFEFQFSLNADELDRSNWVEKGWYSYQNINFFKQKEGHLYMAAMAEQSLRGEQILDIFSWDWEGEHAKLKKLSHQTFSKKGGVGFRWAGGIYKDESARLSLMTCGEQIKESLEIQLWSFE